MPFIASVSRLEPEYTLNQDTTTEFARELFQEDYQDIERLLTVFQNGQIDQRQFAVPIEWFQKEHSLKERNDLYIELATQYSVKAIEKCLNQPFFLKRTIEYKRIDAIVCVTSSGMSTPSLDARIMNHLPFSPHTKRIPLWGLGCAGGTAGVSRAYEYCRAFPDQNVLVVCVELCSLTFQRKDRSKSNLVGTSLFADGIACALICGDDSSVGSDLNQKRSPFVVSTESTLMPHSEDVMGWAVKDSGLHVVFSRSIPAIIRQWLQPTVVSFLDKVGLKIGNISEFIAHPGGKKVLDAYMESLHINEALLTESKDVLRKHGNMSSPTVLYVLEKIMMKDHQEGEYGLMASLGPGFCSEMVLMQWGGMKEG
ncbi:type III polyketide synthase [Halalkalibacter sp. APA_J-10(15)]|uniref:type III polyketide synthase n=1 Tax=unclassified Halalkalibacter TaxID=2893063 RepID=UPI001FF4890E|nr:3-oxoacyl-[acyl-carrier-protein] synthase III C-terminal domain-containing protein [Halalkalibacter sp. APA_J-10(15)]MCK0472363.1 type III polyketide synthase [Halalkalibacter sp. APA_J-10(15)]